MVQYNNMIKYYTGADLALNVVTATATSKDIPVEGAKKVSMRLTRASHSAGSSTFTVTGSVDGANFTTLNNIVTDVTNTNAQTITRVASVALSSNTSQFVSLDLTYLTLKAIRVVATIATDGSATVAASVEIPT